LTEPKQERETHAHDGQNLTKTMETQAPAVIPRTSLRSLLNSDQVKAEIGRALPEHLTADRFVRVALTALTRTPKLADCSRESFMRCMMDCSALGIEPDGRRAHLIPYGKECQLILDYKGLIELARRSGDIASIRAELVCEADEFGWRNGEITHEVNWRAARGDIQAVYAIATLRSGETQSAVLTRDEVDGIRKRSRAGSGSGSESLTGVTGVTLRSVRRSSSLSMASASSTESGSILHKRRTAVFFAISP